MAKIFKKREKEEGVESRDRAFGVLEGFKFGFGFFLAFLAGWLILVVIALIFSLVARMTGISF